MSDSVSNTPRAEEFIIHELALLEGGKHKGKLKVAANAMSVIPWVGGVIAAGNAIHNDKEQGQINQLYQEWLNTHKVKIEALYKDLHEFSVRVEEYQDELDSRLESESYLSLVRKAFRSWDHAETEEKRKYIMNLLTNAATSSICPDDQIRHFNEWIDKYNEIHFMVIKAIVNTDGITRRQIWLSFSDSVPRDDTSDAGLFSLVIRDLSTGGVLRQARRKNNQGQFMKEQTKTRLNSYTMESPFEDTKQYELTELGREFVHYTMNEVITRLG
ncbi:hypothetical protein U5884_003307 [Vibrio parahaemolyticus]|uniref:hypothetical protein n=1 Tax=Vibrio parahaemolyticus TaxID=670 RepID=UPI00186A7619|nr:hypothetical protein [Vibrio parahaemolyticus]EGQ8518389.1 hypothetical protein [Vibrio parahaemolyticus]EHD6029854.1 hypothetical protein [Vibrio parahaemolyticus]EHD6032024.1 hypothetical protein [Vibrio parahaemolyticus]EHD6032154.1 hypothetical protein [Vibrio parahaemolyticus]EJR0956099.1 hypothetical protein [Vibrio parahaemolyticus]